MKYRLPQDAINPSSLHTRSACSTSKNVKKSLICLAIATSLSACGGGGGSSDAPDSPDIPDVIVDIINPVITLVGESNVNHQVGTPYTDAGATAVDNIDGDISLTLSGSVDVTALGDNTLTYTATDAAGNQLTHTRIVSVVDEVNPVITLNGSAIVSHEINTDYIDAGALATDAFEGLLTVETTGNVDTAALGENTITYSAIDSSGNEELQTRTVNVVDTTKPVITLLGDNVGDDTDNKAVTTEAGVPYVEAGATALDAIDGDLLVTITGEVNTAILADYPLTYKATDESGNEQTVTRIVSVIDTTKPVITLNGTAVITLEGGTTYTDLGATALDALDGPVNVTTTGTVNINAVGNYTITYNAVDAAGLTETATRTVTVVDTTEPVITLVGDSAVTIEAGLTYVDDSATAFDATDGQLIVTATSTVDTTMVGTYTVTYTVVDSVGLTQTLIRNVTVADTTKPDITVIGDSTVIVEGNSAYVDAGATAFDAIDGVLVVSTIGSIDTSVVGNQTLTYSATDNSGNVQTATRTVSVVDRINPVITLNGSAIVSHEINTDYTDAGAIATDALEGLLTVETTGNVDTAALGENTITYSAIDSSGNEDRQTRTVNVVDTTKPVITLLGDNVGDDADNKAVTTEAGVPYVEAGATALDTVDGDLLVTITGEVNTAILADYPLTYKATDESGNEQTVTRIVSVIDTTKPVITLNGIAVITLEGGTTYTDLGATALDALDGPVSVTTTGSVNINAVGNYIITYSAVDAAGLIETATRTVTVVDTTEPVITLVGDSAVTIEAGLTYVDASATAFDATDGLLIVTATSTVDTTMVGTYTVTYTVVDSVGLTQTLIRNVTVADTTKPDITVIGDSTVIVEGNSVYDDAGATALDTTDGVLVVTTTGSVNTSVVGDYILTYSATDSSNNTQTASRTVSVVDRIKPDITVIGDSTVTVEGNSVYVDDSATARDGINGVLVVTTTGSVNTSVVGDYILTYSATDSSGNVQTAMRTVSVVDTIKPVINLPNGIGIIVEVGSIFTNDDVNAVDNIDGVIDVVTTGDIDTSMLGDTTFTFSATDNSGNTQTEARILRVTDSISPVIVITGDTDIVHEQGTAYVDQGAVVTDNFDDDIAAIVFNSNVNDAVAGTYIVTYSAFAGADTSGNVAVRVSRNVTVVDTVAPVITLGKYPDELDITLGLGRFYKEYGATAVDAGDGNIVVNISGTVDVNSLGENTVTYTATDSAGNIATTVRTVNIVEPRPMIVTYRLDANEIFTVGSQNDFQIDYGEGAGFQTLTGVQLYSYATAGDHQVKLQGNLDTILFCFNDSPLLRVDDWGDAVWRSFASAFLDCTELDNSVESLGEPDFLTAVANGDETKINMSLGFEDSNFNQPINHWDVSQVDDMGSLFHVSFTQTFDSSFNQPLDNWDVSSVRIFQLMFASEGTNSDAIFNQDINSWDLSSATNMNFMFAVVSGTNHFDQKLDAWQVPNLDRANGMFLNTSLSTENYDALLMNLSEQTLQNGVLFGGGDSQFSSSAQSARDKLANDFGWLINDGGLTP